MLKRIITAVVAIVLFFPVLYFSYTPIFAAVLSLLSFVATLEMLRCTGLWRKWCLTLPISLCAAAFPLIAWWIQEQMTVAYIAVLVMIAFVIYAFSVMTFSRGHITFHDVSISLTGCFYIIAAFTALSMIRYSAHLGKYVYLICFVGAWVTDTFAYFTGRLFGKHKLIPDVSPKKTVEGSVGGILFCVLGLLLYGYIIQKIDTDVTVNYLMLGISGVFVSLVSQAGDLLMSAIKRTYGIKDYGKIFPGHGGVLDRFDSVLAVAHVLLLITPFGSFFS